MVARRFKRILVPTDFGACAAVAVQLAAALGRQHLSELTLLNVLAHDWDYVPPERSEVYASVVRYLKQTSADRLHEVDVGPYDAQALRRETRDSTTAAAGIVECAKEWNVDLIVMGSHGRRLLGQVLLGSVARSVIGHAPCPVLCATPGQRIIVEGDLPKIREILLPTDFSEPSREALHGAIAFARGSGARLALVHVMDVMLPPLLAAEGVTMFLEVADDVRSRMRAMLDEWAAEVSAQGIAVDVVLEEGPVAKRIAAVAAERSADLIILSRRGADGGNHPLGGVVEKLLHDSPCPIMVV